MHVGDRFPVPRPDAAWLDIWDFALTYNAYDRDGGFGKAAELGNRCIQAWNKDGSLPDDLATARSALFFEQRRHRHFGDDPTGASENYIRALVQRISDLTDGWIDGPTDPLP